MRTEPRLKVRAGVTLLSAVMLTGCASSGSSIWNNRGSTSTSSAVPPSSSLPVAATRAHAAPTDGTRNDAVRSASAVASSDPLRDATGRRRTASPPPGAAWDGGLRIDDGTPVSPSAPPRDDDSRDAPRGDSEWESIVQSTALDRATVLELRGNLDAARAAYDQALATSPRDLRTVVSCARFADRHGQDDRATELYLRALELPDSHPVVWSEAGLCLSRHGRYEPGLNACRRAVAAAPDNTRFREQLLAAERCQFAELSTATAPRNASSAGVAPRAATASPSLAVGPAPVVALPEIAAEAPPDSLDDSARTAAAPRTLPFAPGSTARQFERPFPKVSRAGSAFGDVSDEWPRR